MSDDESKEDSFSSFNKYESFCKSRRYLRTQVTRIYNKVQQVYDSMSAAKIASYIEKLETLKVELNDVNKNIHSVLSDDADLDPIIVEEELYHDRIIEALAILKPVESNNSNSTMNSSLPVLENSNKLKLPTVSLPVFSNDKSESLERFFHAFESIIDKHSLSQYEKYLYLKGQLRKGPKSLVSSLEPAEQTYESSKELLTKAFASPITQKYEVIKRMSELKLDVSCDVYEFISEVRGIISTVGLLEIDVDTILQYFIWNSMNDQFQSQLIQITNKTKPDLTEIMENIFSATERYQKVRERHDRKFYDKRNSHMTKDSASMSVPVYKRQCESIDTNNLAVKVNTKHFRPCCLCMADRKTNVSHILKDCHVYDSPYKKTQKLESLDFCAKCSFINHKTSACKFKFSSPCRKCKGNHLTYLCLSSNLNGEFEPVMSQLSAVYFNSAIQSDRVLLPTFSVHIAKQVHMSIVRALYDTGSQRNFVSDRIVKQFNLRSVKSDVELVIHGFNAKKQILTDIVELPLMINKTLITVEAIVVPQIDVKLNTCSYSHVFDAFIDKGYKLADEGLRQSNSCSRLDIVMGPDAVRLLRPQTVEYGCSDKTSVYLTTELGIMLLGEVDIMCKNIRFLEPVKSSHCVIADCVDPDNLNTKHVAPVDISNDSSLICSNSETVQTNINSITEVLDHKGQVIQSKLEQCAEQTLEQFSDAVLNCDTSHDPEINEVNDKIVNYVLSGTQRNSDGRLVMPLPWNPQSQHLLGQNYGLSKKILFSNLKKLQKHDRLSMYDSVFAEQEELGIIERIEDVDSFVSDHPESSFLPHMGIFKMKRDTTKVRVVYLSNLCEKTALQPNAVTHNNALLPGPCLNSKLSTSFMFSRFDQYILIFDITKAFLSIELKECDQNRLLCLWFKSVSQGDFSLIAYRNLRLSFGLRPSPAILMIALYKMLILDTDNDDEETVQLKKLIFNNIYMDNGLVSANSVAILVSHYHKISDIFEGYKMTLQQFASNDSNLQSLIDNDFETKTENTIKFFGMQWNRDVDTLGPLPIKLDPTSNTKRKILSTLNAVYDLFNLYGPILNRAKIFLHRIQCDKSLEWDSVLKPELLSEWQLICKQVNATPVITVNRFVGSRAGRYNLVAFCDASSVSYGVVVYIVDIDTSSVSFLLAKNRIVNTKLTKKSIPSLECQAITLAAEILDDTYRELSHERNYLPVNICDLFVYSDSMVSLSWIKAFFVDHGKMQKRSTFVQNRLKRIGNLCHDKAMTFRYIEGKENPADCISRPFSYKQLQSTNYLSGPDFLKDIPAQPDIEVRVSDKVDIDGLCSHSGEWNENISFLSSTSQSVCTVLAPQPQRVNPERFSCFEKVLSVYKLLYKYLGNLRKAVAKRKNETYDEICNNSLSVMATKLFIRTEQALYYPEVVNFFNERKIKTCRTPSLVLQMNLFLDDDSIIRVKCKLNYNANCPILIPTNSFASNLIVRSVHQKNMHAGLYCTLRELRKTFWLPRGFSTVRTILRQCVTCKRVNERPLKLNQSSYREFRSNPIKIPFSTVFLDYIGPLNVRLAGTVRKMWLLIVTCLWSRAISLQVCFSADTTDFLRSLQLHVYRFGLFQSCLSDLGSQIVAGTNIIFNFLNDIECREYLESNGVKHVTFDQYPKGNSSLGSLVENCVKQVKHLMIKAIGRKILRFPEFELLVAKTMHVVNRRPISFKEVLRDFSTEFEFPEPITPEMLLFGRELTSVNIIPDLQDNNFDNYSESEGIPEMIRQQYRDLFS